MGEETGRRPVGELDSLEMLTHGIFAITMTLLVLDLRLPNHYRAGHLGSALWGLHTQAIAFALGFLYLMSNWLPIRQGLRRMRSVSTGELICYLISLALLSVTPFLVRTIAGAAGNSHDLGVAVRLMAIVVTATGAVSALGMWLGHRVAGQPLTRPVSILAVLVAAPAAAMILS